MEIYFKDTKVKYYVCGRRKKAILMLHGWGDSGESMKFFCDKLLKNKKYIIIDFPPFGESKELKSDWTIKDYSNLCLKVLDKEGLKKVDIISHSFGGRVAIFLASNYTERVDRLLMIASAGLKSRNRWIVKLKVLLFKLKKLLGFKNLDSGSSDYKNASDSTKKTFCNIVNYFQEKEAKKIKNETLLVWGSEDKSTPLYMGKKFSRLIKNSSLIVFDGAGHFPHYDDIYKFSMIANSFLKDR